MGKIIHLCHDQNCNSMGQFVQVFLAHSGRCRQLNDMASHCKVNGEQ
jgi:hypothetical protein